MSAECIGTNNKLEMEIGTNNLRLSVGTNKVMELKMGTNNMKEMSTNKMSVEELSAERMGTNNMMEMEMGTNKMMEMGTNNITKLGRVGTNNEAHLTGQSLEIGVGGEIQQENKTTDQALRVAQPDQVGPAYLSGSGLAQGCEARQDLLENGSSRD